MHSLSFALLSPHPGAAFACILMGVSLDSDMHSINNFLFVQSTREVHIWLDSDVRSLSFALRSLPRGGVHFVRICYGRIAGL